MPHTYTSPLLGKNTTLGYKIGAAVSFSTITQLVDIDTDFGVKVAEYLRLSDTAQRRLPTIFDAGECSGTLLWEPGAQEGIDLTTLLTTPQIAQWEITMSDTTTIAFAGILSKLSPSFANEDVVEASFSIAIDGAIVITPPAT